MTQAPTFSLGTVVLNVSNLDLQTQFYSQVIGLAILDQTRTSVELGIEGEKTVLLRLEKTELPGQADYGLFHIAILLPDRTSLATVFRHLLTNQIPLQGGSDHGYSEAIYLEDTEGNGIELYRDKPVSDWDIRKDGRIVGKTEALQADDLLSLAETSPTPYRLPKGTVTGHIHLSVPDAQASSRRFQKIFGFEDKFTMSSASFIAAGLYHHHLAFNHWAGKKLSKRETDRPGLKHLSLHTKDSLLFETAKRKAPIYGMTLIDIKDQQFLLEDPDGIRVLVHKS